MTFESLDPEWSQLLSLGTEAQRRVKDHPLHLYYGTNYRNQPIFFLRTSKEPDFPQFSDVVSVELRERQDSSEWTVVLTLEDDSLIDTFIRLCSDLASTSSKGDSEEDALRLFYEALSQFRKIFHRNTTRSFSKEEQRGLVAELWVALRLMTLHLPAEQVLTAWKGPYDAPQDFRLPTGDFVEVKAVHSESRSVQISSAEQLFVSSSGKLTLMLVTIEEINDEHPASFSIPSLITEFRQKIEHDEEASIGLNDRLKNLKVLDSFHTYTQHYLAPAVRTYEVSEGFPRVSPEVVPLGVDQLQYRLQIAALRKFEVYPYEGIVISDL